MSSFTNYLAAELLDHIFTDGAYSPPSTLYFGLISALTDAEAGTVTELPATGSYARAATTAADWGAATSADPSVKSNTTAITFPTATANWNSGSTIPYWGLWDASSSGNLLIWGTFTLPKAVLSGDTATFAVGNVQITLD